MTRCASCRSMALAALTAALVVPLLLAGCSTSSYLWYRLAPDYPAYETETITVPGLEQPVTVHLDAAGVPHISAASEPDLLRAIGFVHGRDRFFGMDVLRRLAAGTLSELLGRQPALGSDTVALDALMRGWGFARGAAADEASLAPQLRALLAAYTEGVNHALALHVPIEHRLLGVKPEPWVIADSFALGRLNGWSITHNWGQETVRLLLALYVGTARAEQLYPSEPWPGMTSLPPEKAAVALPPAVAPELEELFPPRAYAATQRSAGQLQAALDVIPLLQAGASNSWVVGGERTVAGKPLLANDPHLSHLLPSLLYQQQIRCPGLDAIGATIPGIPWVLMGHNGRVGWAMTSATADVVDLYVEKVHPDDPGSVLSRSGAYVPLASETLVVRERRGATLMPHDFVLRSSENGPLLNDLYPGLLPPWAPPVAIHWAPDGGAQGIVGFARANRAASVDELYDELADIPLPANTWSAADVDGAVALFVSGRIPIRRGHRGTFPAPGWLPGYAWDGWYAAKTQPHGRGRGAAVFANANNLMIDPYRSPQVFHVDSAPSYRLERVMALLARTDKHDLQSFAAIQQDVHLLRAASVAPHMLEDLAAAAAGLSSLELEAFQLLQRWDHNGRAASPEPAIFFLTYRNALIAAAEDELDARGLRFFLGERYTFHPVDSWYESTDHPVWDQRKTAEQREQRRDVVVPAFRAAVAHLAATQGGSPAGWRWGRLHVHIPSHLFGKEIPELVDLEPTELGGGLSSVWKAHFDMSRADSPFRVTAGAAFRMIVDFADPGHGLWILDTGASGWPASPHYGDQYRLWREGRYLPMVSDRGEVERQAVGVLTLVPAR
ncbi:MAG: penicillin acylase family protein [Deltaproteobacteria bacterium]|nr:penicillin acylase family protein [Deltaproteobacteria bacterium]